MLTSDQKKHFLRRLTALENERKKGWEPHWRDLARHFMPRRSRFLDAGEPTNDGDRKNHLADNAGIKARRDLSAGMQSGLTSPARPWFSLSLQDKQLTLIASVKWWLHTTYEAMANVFNRSNFYDQMHLLYDELGVFGTGVMIVEEDSTSTIRCRTLTAGEYCIDTNAEGRVDTLYRRVRMTARQIVEAWPETVPDRVRNMAEQDNQEWLTILHAIEPNPDYRKDAQSPKHRRYLSVYMLLEHGQDVLEKAGYFEFPALCPRWNTTASDIYGESPAMDALGDCQLLQKLAEDGLAALEMEVNPPLAASHGSGIIGPIDTSPGAINYYNSLVAGQNQAITPLYQVRANLAALEQVKAQTRQNIKEAFYSDLFLMISDVHRQMTATEVAERNSEKMLMLGPVLDRLRSEIFQPLIERVFGIMRRKGLIYQAPEELQGLEIKIEFISILAQAQKQAGIAAVNQTVAFIGGLAQMNPDALDKLNVDEAIDEVAEMEGVPPKLIRSTEEVQQIREQKQQMMQQQMMMNAMEQGAGIAKTGADALGGIAGASEAMNAMAGGAENAGATVQ